LELPKSDSHLNRKVFEMFELGTNQKQQNSAVQTELPATQFSKEQIKRGLLILVAFVILRAVLARVGQVDQGLEFNTRSILFLLGTFFIMSVGLVYFGFSRWVGIDLGQWWRFERKRLLGDGGWGLLGYLGGMVLTLAIVIPVAQLGLVPESVMNNQAGTPSLGGWLLGLFFGFAIAGFQEETIFRGFLQGVLTERFGRWPGNLGQAALFSLAHVGYFPWGAWPLFILTFGLGLIYGWLRLKRSALVAPWLAHGLMG
jgi:membrane protease YdiL (CAAX protease family)